MRSVPCPCALGGLRGLLARAYGCPVCGAGTSPVHVVPRLRVLSGKRVAARGA